MRTQSGRARYDALTMLFHWVIFGLVGLMFALAWILFTSPENDPSILPTILLHKSTGITVLVLVVLRLAWRQFNPPPPMPEEMPASLRLAARAAHGLLYLLLLTVPIAGWLVSSSAGITVKPFDLFSLPNLVEKNRALHEQLEAIHLVLALVLLALVVLHALGGLYHHFVRRDDTLSRMIPFIRPRRAPITKGATFLAGALAAGVALPAFAASDWAIVPTESRIMLTGKLEGQDAEVDLKSLAGDIVFDPADLAGSRVRIVIDLVNMAAGFDEMITTLSSAPWFDVQAFPSAVFTSQAITKRPDGRYAAEGTLALKGASRPVTVLFAYENRGAAPGKPGVQRALATGEAVIDRTAFAVGEDAWSKSVAKDVRVTFTVLAERRPAP